MKGQHSPSKPQSIVETVRKGLRHLEVAWSPQTYLDTGIPDLNEVLGSRDLGIPYGRALEISGLESHGKTALALTLAALAQKQDAYVVWIDFENSYDDRWVRTRGLDPDHNFSLFQPYEGLFGSEKTPRIISGQELCDEVETALPLIHKQTECMVLILDSLPAILLAEEGNIDLANRNLRTSMALPVFLGALAKRWVPKARSYNILLIFVNQMRQNPMAMFGDPWYTPGGNALKFYLHVRARARRTKGGKILQKGKQVGMQGILSNVKNKVGGVEGSKVGYKIYFHGLTEFLSIEELKQGGGDED
jgi:recombination protein RecA